MSQRHIILIKAVITALVLEDLAVYFVNQSCVFRKYLSWRQQYVWGQGRQRRKPFGDNFFVEWQGNNIHEKITRVGLKFLNKQMSWVIGLVSVELQKGQQELLHVALKKMHVSRGSVLLHLIENMPKRVVEKEANESVVRTNDTLQFGASGIKRDSKFK